ncbi:hypothetical protein ACWD4O_39140 [Streptomyces sp. NPDC002623]
MSERRRKLARLRRQGVRFDDDRILDLGYASANAARRDMNRALTRNREAEALEVATYRQQENERLDELLEAAWPRATEPQPIFDKEGIVVGKAIDMRAVDTVLRLMDRRAKLNGLDMPVRTEISGPDGGAIPFSNGELSELEALIDISGQEEAEAPAIDPDAHEDDEDGDGDVEEDDVDDDEDA